MSLLKKITNIDTTSKFDLIGNILCYYIHCAKYLLGHFRTDLVNRLGNPVPVYEREIGQVVWTTSSSL